MTDNTEQPLSATTFEPAPTASESTAPAEKGPQSRVVLIALAAATLLLLFVFFVLPRLVTPGDTEPDATATQRDTPAAGSATPAINSAAEIGTSRSPFAEAQESALRREAQEVLQSLLTLQESLAERGAARWGEPTYSEALGKAAAGDTAYRERDFMEATAQYQQALDQLLAMEASLPERIETLHASVVSAIEAGEVLTAQAGFTELAQMAPADIRLITLEDRIGSLPNVVVALEAAATAEKGGRLTEAVAAATDATRADPAHRRAKTRLAELQSALTRERFTVAMTAGYGALAAQGFDQAETQFRNAARLIPGAPEPASALAEVDQARTQNTLLNLKESGMQAEREERWADAVTLYKQALEIDALMLFATEGAARATPRADLDARLEKIPEERDRLIDARIMRLAQDSLAEATAIVNPGSRLTSQISRAQETIAYASTPVSVTMTSDGLTDITLLRVKRLGTLAEQALTLRPGLYTAVGIRNGYRDVRVKFEVRPNQRNAVEVRCVEPI